MRREVFKSSVGRIIENENKNKTNKRALAGLPKKTDKKKRGQSRVESTSFVKGQESFEAPSVAAQANEQVNFSILSQTPSRPLSPKYIQIFKFLLFFPSLPRSFQMPSRPHLSQYSHNRPVGHSVLSIFKSSNFFFSSLHFLAVFKCPIGRICLILSSGWHTKSGHSSSPRNPRPQLSNVSSIAQGTQTDGRTDEQRRSVG